MSTHLLIIQGRDRAQITRSPDCVDVKKSNHLLFLFLTCPFASNHLHTTLLTREHTAGHSAVSSSLSESGLTEKQAALMKITVAA